MPPPIDDPRPFGSLAISSPSPSPSPPPFESRNSHLSRPSWSRARSSASQRPHTLQAKAIARANALYSNAGKIWRSLSLWQKVALVLVGLTVNVLIILFFVYNEALMTWLRPHAVAWRERNGGWLLIWFFAFITAFPPLIGYSTSITMCGFIYGVWPGWPIAATANIAGSTASFLVSRYYLHDWIERKVANDKRFQALALVLKHDGLKLLVMIRLCPLPYSLSNGAMSTFPTVSPVMFAAATALASPKLLLHVFIGSRFAEIGRDDGEDSTAKTVNYVSIAFGIILGAVTGWIIWSRTQARSRQLEAEEQAKLMEDGRGGGLDEEEEDAGHQRLAHPDAFIDDDAQELGDEEIGAHNDVIDFLGSPAREHPKDPYTDDHDNASDELKGDVR